MRMQGLNDNKISEDLFKSQNSKQRQGPCALYVTGQTGGAPFVLQAEETEEGGPPAVVLLGEGPQKGVAATQRGACKEEGLHAH